MQPFILADIGEGVFDIPQQFSRMHGLITSFAGIKEVQIIQWFVKPGARVEQFDKLCEVTSDKAMVEITSRFDGIIKKLHYEPEDMAQVGKPLCDIDVQADSLTEDETSKKDREIASKATGQKTLSDAHAEAEQPGQREIATPSKPDAAPRSRKLATPAVRALMKELDISIDEVHGSGQEGRILQEDVQRHAARSRSGQPHSIDVQQNKEIALTPVQAAMFKTMTQSLSIPHFLFSDDVGLAALDALRQRLHAFNPSAPRLTYLPFILKAVSLALNSYPLLNAHLRVPDDSGPPTLTYRPRHNIGIATDTAHGLLVPNLKDVAAHTIPDLATALADLVGRARAGTLTPADMSGGTITVSNVGALGGGITMAPMLLPGELAILGIGRAREVPAFDSDGKVVRRKVASFCWSADHRVVDGATMARMAGRVKDLLEDPRRMVVEMR